MSDLEESFLQQIARQPHDWLPRLIFADWLEERGDPRGELIRLSHQLTRLDCENRSSKEARLQELAAAGVVWPSPSLSNSLEMSFVLIPPGEFRMGSPENEPDRYSSETQVDVTLTQGFWLGQYPVMQAEWEQIMETTVGQQAENEIMSKKLAGTGSAHPIYYVSWEEAMEFCRKLTAQECAAGRLPADWEYTLPTEAQWEYACRAGTTTAVAFGDRLASTQANFNGNYPYNGPEKGKFKAKTMPVGSYQPNAWHLSDMHGNVYEWCRDWYSDRLPGGIDPEVVDTALHRMSRGGSWGNRGSSCRSAVRNRSTPDHRSNKQGFRLAAVQAR